jgi:hypothetical protein
VDVNVQAPTFLILSETRISDRNKNLNNTYKGMYCNQHSSSGQNAKGVVVFAKKGIEQVEGSVHNNEEGFFTIAVYSIEGSRIIVVGIYGPPENLDRKAYDIFSEMFEKIEMYMQVYGTQMVMMGGDLNVHMDRTTSSKPRTVRLIKEFTTRWCLTDLGGEDKRFTWSRPGGGGG